jgi:hypothetical protein
MKFRSKLGPAVDVGRVDRFMLQYHFPVQRFLAPARSKGIYSLKKIRQHGASPNCKKLFVGIYLSPIQYNGMDE